MSKLLTGTVYATKNNKICIIHDLHCMLHLFPNVLYPHNQLCCSSHKCMILTRYKIQYQLALQQQRNNRPNIHFQTFLSSRVCICKVFPTDLSSGVVHGVCGGRGGDKVEWEERRGGDKVEWGGEEETRLNEGERRKLHLFFSCEHWVTLCLIWVGVVLTYNALKNFCNTKVIFYSLKWFIYIKM